tara:strand:+ start:312 stop:443 length:132 start_codon:yes stop_codon:yes gene_type:complete
MVVLDQLMGNILCLLLVEVVLAVREKVLQHQIGLLELGLVMVV